MWIWKNNCLANWRCAQLERLRVEHARGLREVLRPHKKKIAPGWARQIQAFPCQGAGYVNTQNHLKLVPTCRYILEMYAVLISLLAILNQQRFLSSKTLIFDIEIIDLRIKELLLDYLNVLSIDLVQVSLKNVYFWRSYGHLKVRDVFRKYCASIRNAIVETRKCS